MASEMGWGGVPLMRPSNLATRYQLYERDIIPERCIETGQRYRARRNLVEHVSSPSRVIMEAAAADSFRHHLWNTYFKSCSQHERMAS